MLFYVLKKLRGSVRTKILIVVFIALALPAVLVFIEGRVLLNAITPLENEVLTKQRLRFERLVDTERNELLGNVVAWSIWDEFWDYVDHHDEPEWEEWRQVNVDDYVPQFHKVQIVLIADQAGRLIYQYGDLPEFGVGEDLSSTPLFQVIQREKTLIGFLRTSKGYVLVAGSTVHRTDDTAMAGPTNGVYLIGRLVDDAYLDAAFGSRLLAPVAMTADGFRAGDDAVMSTGTEALDRSQREYTSEDMTIAFPLSHVLFGADVPTVRITEPRSLFRIAYAQLLQTGIAVSGLIVLALVLTFFVFERIVFRPLFHFLEQVEESGKAGKLTSVMVAKTGDEFEHLTKTYNSMVEAVGRAEEQLLVSQKFLRTVLETVLLPIIIVDKDSDRVTMVNPAGRALLVETVGSKDWTDFLAFLKATRTLDGGVYPMAKHPYVLAKSKERAAKADDVMIRAAGKSAYFSVTAQPLQLSKSDRPQVLVASFDISKQREVEKLRTEFADIVAHQLRTPLTSLKWAVEATAGASPKERDAYLQEIAATVDRTLTLINQLLSIARLAAGRTKFAVQPTPVRPIVQAVATELKPTCDHKKIAVAIDVPAGVEAQADANGLREVLANLLSNAIKYSPAGATVRVSSTVEPDGVVIAVADAGIGIPAAEQGKIFEKFFRASNVAGDEGTGLGLATVKDFTEAMGGTVWFDSAEGKGSTFFVRLKAGGKVA